MSPRSTFALGLGGLAALAALVLGVTKQIGVKSFGHPAGRVVRAGQDLCVLIETCDPYLPSLKGARESDMSYSYALWQIPETGDGDIRTIRLEQGVSSNARTHNIGVQQYDSGILWLAIKDLQGVELASGKKTTKLAPASLVNAPISQLMGSSEPALEQFRAQSVTLASGDRLFLANDDELQSSLKPGTRLYDNPDAKGSYKPRKLHTITSQPGPIARIADVTRLSDREFRNGAFMRGSKGGAVVRFINPDGFLVVHDAGDPVHPTMHFSRLNLDGSVAWTIDTKIGRLIQVLPHDSLPAFVGEPPQQLTEPMLAVVALKDGTVKTKSLKGPLN